MIWMPAVMKLIASMTSFLNTDHFDLLIVFIFSYGRLEKLLVQINIRLLCVPIMINDEEIISRTVIWRHKYLYDLSYIYPLAVGPLATTRVGQQHKVAITRAGFAAPRVRRRRERRDTRGRHRINHAPAPLEHRRTNPIRPPRGWCPYLRRIWIAAIRDPKATSS